MGKITRRDFFGKMIGSIAGLIGLGLAIPIFGYTILPALRKPEESWSEAGPVDQLEINRPKELEIIRSLSSGWMKTSTAQSIWAFRKPDGKIVVYSPLCPHLGCGYQWVDNKKNFHCPCHNSIYDLDGKVLGGPAPRPLDTLPVKTEGDRLFVQYKDFKAGTSKKEEI